MTPIKAIRAKCQDCCCGQYKEVALCPCTDCPLYPYRFGKDPHRSGTVNKGSFSKKLTAQPVEKSRAQSEEGKDTTPHTDPVKRGVDAGKET